MTTKKHSLLNQKDTPLVYHFNALAKGYFGILTKELEDLDLERYYFSLTLITKHKTISQQRLADVLDIDKANMVRMIDYLSNQGYVKREVNPDDRREHIILPTKKAEKVFDRVQNAFLKSNKEALKGFSVSETKVFYEMLERACHNLSEIPSQQYFLKYVKTKPKSK